MTAAWMAYSLAISCLLGVAALAVERACRLRRWPSRWIWTLVLAAPFLLPFTARVADQPVALVESPAATRNSATGGVDEPPRSPHAETAAVSSSPAAMRASRFTRLP